MGHRGGSSPRLLGTPEQTITDPGHGRFIPTPVGNTATPSGTPSATPVHPHACGEHILMAGRSRQPNGSSPRLWGTLQGQDPGRLNPRFIPTPVGNTYSAAAEREQASVHPHACGEHTARLQIIVPYCGSSPRLWGTLGLAIERSVTLRFIPTPVGNTSNSWPSGSEMAVHPHACGEHMGFSMLCLMGRGSSPRLWGTPAQASQSLPPRRFIPTPVGNTSTPPGTSSGWTVHPHACGEHQ